MWNALREWSGEDLHARVDRETGTLMLVAVHRSRDGRAGGGTRMKVYDSEEAAVRDALALAEAMTCKWTLAGIPIGGAKAVLAVPADLAPAARPDLLRRYGSFVASLRDAFRTGPDVGTTPEDMDLIAETAGDAVSSRASQGVQGGSTAPTAVGVLAGIRASIAHLFGDAPLAERSFAIQGLGGVGSRVARELAEQGARVVVADVDAAAVTRVCEGTRIEAVAPESIYDVACDLFSPCALGGVLGPDTIPRLRCRIVAGAANNQLASPDAAKLLAERGILYAPDYAINAGGVIGVVGVESYGWSEERARDEVEGRITRNLRAIYELAERDGVDTETAARTLVASSQVSSSGRRTG